MIQVCFQGKIIKIIVEVSCLIIAGDYYTVITPSELHYEHVWITTELNYFQFTVMACHDVHVALSEQPWNYSSNTFEVVIGGWSKTHSAIRSSHRVSV